MHKQKSSVDTEFAAVYLFSSGFHFHRTVSRCAFLFKQKNKLNTSTLKWI